MELLPIVNDRDLLPSCRVKIAKHDDNEIIHDDVLPTTFSSFSLSAELPSLVSYISLP